jgi:hypothetical protein
MRARKLNKIGMERYQACVMQARDLSRRRLPVPAVPSELVEIGECCEDFDLDLPETPTAFPTKLAIGEFFGQAMTALRFEQVRGQVGFWTWCTAVYFDLLTNGRTKIKEPRAYVAALTFQEFYRHLILGPCHIYFLARDNLDHVRVLLYDEPTTMNEVMVQFGSYQTLMQNRALQRVIQRLYFDMGTGRIKRGAGGKEAGSPRRLMDFFRQIELNYDLLSVSEARFWEMLPAEFNRYKQA